MGIGSSSFAIVDSDLIAPWDEVEGCDTVSIAPIGRIVHSKYVRGLRRRRRFRLLCHRPNPVHIKRPAPIGREQSGLLLLILIINGIPL